jgi:hypothetical protein
MSDERWNKAERLAVAGVVAPALRGQAAETSKRRVARVDAAGNVVGYTTLAEVQAALVAKRGLEIQTVDGVRPSEALCERCGLPAKVRRASRVVGNVTRCERCTYLRCADCGKKLPRNYSSPSMLKEERVCRPCGKVRTASNLPRCVDCGALRSRNVVWQYRKRWGDDEPLRCGGCSREARRLVASACGGCGQPLPYSSLFSARTKAGKAPMCRSCYRGDVRRAIAKEKAERDPAYRARRDAALAKGRERQKAS